MRQFGFFQPSSGRYST